MERFRILTFQNRKIVLIDASDMKPCKEFKQLIDAFHREGIGVIIDTVMVHFPKDVTGLALYDNDNYLYEHPIPERKMTPWNTFYFDFARNEVRSFLISSLFHWIEEFYIDGFRFDAAGQFHYYEFSSQRDYQWFLQKYGNCTIRKDFVLCSL